jgi:hypothetical protein
MKNIDIDVLDELVGICEQSIGSRFKKAKPAEVEPPPAADDDDINVDELASLYEE